MALISLVPLHLLLPLFLLLLLSPSLTDSFVFRASPSLYCHPPKPILHGKGPFSSADELKQSLNSPSSTSPDLDNQLKTKLFAETIAPWRSLRLFLYASLGAGAFISTLLTSATLAAHFTHSRTDVDVKAASINLAIDLVAVVSFAVFAKIDLEKNSELVERVSNKLNSKSTVISDEIMASRESQLSSLSLGLVLPDQEVSELSVTDVQSNMKQNIVVLAGSKTFIRDALLTAGLCKQIFPPNNVLIVPVKTDALPEGNGFKVVDGPTNTNTNTRPYVATPLGEGWSTLIDNELEDAKSQGNGARAKLEGIVLVVSSQGKIVRRGLGLPEWRELVEKF